VTQGSGAGIAHEGNDARLGLRLLAGSIRSARRAACRSMSRPGCPPPEEARGRSRSFLIEME